MDRDSIERIRTATFTIARRGYDKRQVDHFLVQVAEWLETGGDDDARSEVVRAELARIGTETSKILTEAHDVAAALRADAGQEAREALEQSTSEADEQRTAADRYASGVRAEADTHSERTHIEADEYAGETRSEADAYAARARNEANAEAATTREDADEYATTTRGEAEEAAVQAHRRAEQRGAQIVEEANQRRVDTEKQIADLEERRDAVLADMKRLSGELVGTASEHQVPDPTKQPAGEG